MAREVTEIRLRTEIDQDKVDELRAALIHFDECSNELRKATSRVQDAVYSMNDAISIKRV